MATSTKRNTTKHTSTTSTKKPVSKAQQARKIFERNLKRKKPLSRQGVIAQFIEKTGLTKNGSSTYYTNCDHYFREQSVA